MTCEVGAASHTDLIFGGPHDLDQVQTGGPEAFFGPVTRIHWGMLGRPKDEPSRGIFHPTPSTNPKPTLHPIQNQSSQYHLLGLDPSKATRLPHVPVRTYRGTALLVVLGPLSPVGQGIRIDMA